MKMVRVEWWAETIGSHEGDKQGGYINVEDKGGEQRRVATLAVNHVLLRDKVGRKKKKGNGR